jgi:hypothetical protein
MPVNRAAEDTNTQYTVSKSFHWIKREKYQVGMTSGQPVELRAVNIGTMLIAGSAHGPIIWSHGLQGAVEQNIHVQTIKLQRERSTKYRIYWARP